MPWPEVAERDDVALQPARCAVQSRRASSSSLSDWLSQRARFRPAQPVVEDDGGDLAALAASGAVAQHPAPAEAHRLR